MLLTVFREGRNMDEVLNRPIDTEYYQAFVNLRLLLKVFEEMGCPFSPDDAVLDFGCGEGKMVYALRKLGYHAFGTDIVRPEVSVKRRIRRECLCRGGERPFAIIDKHRYRIPFDDNFFDFVFSWEVMEHVQNHAQALCEIRRVLKPGGKSLHYFPARYRILEPHIGVPFAALIQGYGYLYLWALAGLRDSSQQGMPAREVARKNYEYLHSETRYLTKKQLLQVAGGCFERVEFVERHVWKHNTGTSGAIYRLLSKLGLAGFVPMAARLLSPFGRRAVFCVKESARVALLCCADFR